MYPVLALLLAVLGLFTLVALSERGRSLVAARLAGIRSARQRQAPTGARSVGQAPGPPHLGAVGPGQPPGPILAWPSEQERRDWPPPSNAARETLDGFALVGGSGLLIVAVAVVVIGLVTPDNGIADLIAMIAFFAYLVFVAVALVLARRAR